jgi:hypothetical protein
MNALQSNHEAKSGWQNWLEALHPNAKRKVRTQWRTIAEGFLKTGNLPLVHHKDQRRVAPNATMMEITPSSPDYFQMISDQMPFSGLYEQKDWLLAFTQYLVDTFTAAAAFMGQCDFVFVTGNVLVPMDPALEAPCANPAFESVKKHAPYRRIYTANVGDWCGVHRTAHFLAQFLEHVPSAAIIQVCYNWQQYFPIQLMKQYDLILQHKREYGHNKGGCAILMDSYENFADFWCYLSLDERASTRLKIDALTDFECHPRLGLRQVNNNRITPFYRPVLGRKLGMHTGWTRSVEYEWISLDSGGKVGCAPSGAGMKPKQPGSGSELAITEGMGGLKLQDNNASSLKAAASMCNDDDDDDVSAERNAARMYSVATRHTGTGEASSASDPLEAIAVKKGATGCKEAGTNVCEADYACGNPSCDKTGSKRCSVCKVERYCSRECQTNHWSVHRDECSLRSVVLVDGDNVWEERWSGSRSKINRDWDACPVPALLGVPLFGKKHIRPSAVEPSNHLATWMMVDPVTVFASTHGFKWMGGARNQLGVSVFLRSDGKDFTAAHFQQLQRYFYKEGGEVAEGIKEPHEVWNADAFKRSVNQTAAKDKRGS